MNKIEKNLTAKIMFYIALGSILVLLLFAGPSWIGVSRVSAQSYPTLRVRVRYLDGSSAEGVKVALYQDEWVEDKYEGDCLVPRSGFCEFTLKRDVQYILKFPNGEQPDPITAYAAGHSGIDGIGIMLRDGYTMGFVLSKLVEEEADANWMLLDLAPEEAAPRPRIPEGAVEEARKILEEEQTQEEVETYPTVTPIPTVEVVQITVPTIAVPELAEAGVGAGTEAMTEEPLAGSRGEIALSETDLIDVEDVQTSNGDDSAQAGENDSFSGVAGTEEDGRYFYQLVILAILVLALLFILGWIAVTIRDMRTNNRSGK